eukprot:134764-Amphidinium_carterae.1
MSKCAAAARWTSAMVVELSMRMSSCAKCMPGWPGGLWLYGRGSHIKSAPSSRSSRVCSG